MRLNVLVVDDDAFFRRMMIRTLVALDAEFTFCVDGTECLEVVDSKLFDYDVVFMDVHMSNLLGSEVTQTIRTMAGNPLRQVPIIALTGDPSWCDKERCASAGFTDYMLKPNDMADLYVQIGKALLQWTQEDAYADARRRN